MFRDFLHVSNVVGAPAAMVDVVVPSVGSDLPLQTSATRVNPVGRAIDIVVALLALVVFAPIMVVCMILIIVSNSGPVLFRQQRIGRGGRSFTCYKFRTMRTDADKVLDELLAASPEVRAEWNEFHKLRNDPRIIGAGKFLRRTSFDELPQLFNVLMGDMAIVGPRPIVTSEIPRYGRYIDAYCTLRPGITGLWQVTGRSETTYRRRVACDVIYCRQQSARRDLWLMACTVPVVVFGRGAC